MLLQIKTIEIDMGSNGDYKIWKHSWLFGGYLEFFVRAKNLLHYKQMQVSSCWYFHTS